MTTPKSQPAAVVKATTPTSSPDPRIRKLARLIGRQMAREEFARRMRDTKTSNRQSG